MSLRNAVILVITGFAGFYWLFGSTGDDRSKSHGVFGQWVVGSVDWVDSRTCLSSNISLTGDGEPRLMISRTMREKAPHFISVDFDEPISSNATSTISILGTRYQLSKTVSGGNLSYRDNNQAFQKMLFSGVVFVDAKLRGGRIVKAAIETVGLQEAYAKMQEICP